MLVPKFGQSAHIHALQTTRDGGVSNVPWDSLNLGDHVADNPQHVASNRQHLVNKHGLPKQPVWLQQVHGVAVLEVTTLNTGSADYVSPPVADAVFTRCKNTPIAIMTADCLPLLLTDKAGTVIAAVHAGWRSLCAGVIEACIESMAVSADQILVWLGPAISPQAFEVGGEVREQFLAQAVSTEQQTQIAKAFLVSDVPSNKWLADMKQLASIRLAQLGVRLSNITINDECTFAQADRYFSYRRDGQTGRMASIIWMS